MGTFTRADIVLFPFPYTDLSNRKLRPCLVISEEMKDDVILCQITSKNIPKDDYSVEISTRDTQNGSLKVDSYIRANMIFTADKSQITKKVCRLVDSKYKEVADTISKIITR